MRLLVPDVARGLALLGIAMANAPTAWFTDDVDERADFFGGAHSGLDDATVLATAVTTHVRGLPMFSTLLGFGIGLIMMSLWKRQYPAQRARTVVMKRYAFLALFGAIHCIFIFHGDIMFLYGICGVAFGLLFMLKNSTLLAIAYTGLAIGSTGGIILSSFSSLVEDSSQLVSAEGLGVDSQNYGILVLYNGGFFLLQLLALPLFVFQLMPLMIIGFVWARRGVLANPDEHRRELGIWATIAAVVAVGVGVPWGLAALDVLPPTVEAVTLTLNQSLGLLTGPGILAGLALLLNRRQKAVWAGAAVPIWLAVPAALGKRSMSGYLFQSFAFAVLAYGFFLGLDLDAFGMAAYAFGVWLASLGLAWALEVAGKPGPFEWVHRRLAYGRTGTPQP